jgi:hypothetical protein
VDEVGRDRGKKVALTRAAEWWAKGCPGSDLEKHLAGLRDEGYCEEALAIERAEGEALREDGRIHPTDWPVIRVFTACSWSHTPVGLSGSVPTGIAAAEIAAVCHLMRVPAADRPDMLGSIRTMVAAALPLLRPKET